MGQHNFYGHINRQQQGPADRIAAAGYVALVSGENIARGFIDPVGVVDGWMHSPGHRANILNGEFLAIGAGHYWNGASADGHFWTHDFAAPDPSLSRDRGRYIAELVTAINRLRVAAGCPELVVAGKLQQAVQIQLISLVQTGHGAIERRTQESTRSITALAGYAYRRLSAQITYGASSATPERVLDAWMQTSFRGQIVDCAYQEIAAGYLYRREDVNRHYWLLLLAVPVT